MLLILFNNKHILSTQTVSSIENVFIWPTDETLTGTNTTGQRGTGSNINQDVLHIPQSS